MKTRYEVAEIPKSDADVFIKRHHYSGSVVWSSSVHLGIFERELLGVLQFGPAMNPQSGAKVVEGCKPREWLELNRMAFVAHEENAISSAMAGVMRFLRFWHPQLTWLQTFADSRCKKMGAVYQACSWLYLGCHDTVVYELDGEFFHRSMLHRPAVDKRGWGSGPKIARIRGREHEATQHKVTHYRYFKPLRRSVLSRLLLPALPYPKPDNAEVGNT